MDFLYFQMDLQAFRAFQEKLYDSCLKQSVSHEFPTFHEEQTPKPIKRKKKLYKPRSHQNDPPPSDQKALTEESMCCISLGERKGRCWKPHASITFTLRLRRLGRKNLVFLSKSNDSSHDNICLFHWRLLKYSSRYCRSTGIDSLPEDTPTALELYEIALDEEIENESEEDTRKKAKRSRTRASSEEAESEAESTISSLGSAEFSMSDDSEEEAISDTEARNGEESDDEQDDDSVKKEEESDDDEEMETNGRIPLGQTEDEDVDYDLNDTRDDDDLSDAELEEDYTRPWEYDQHVERLTEEVLVELPSEDFVGEGDPLDWQRNCVDPDESTSEDSDDDYDDSDTETTALHTGLNNLSAATLRRYRKVFHIPTRSSATKPVMLQGVKNHFSRIQVDSDCAVTAFLAKTIDIKPKREEDEEREDDQEM